LEREKMIKKKNIGTLLREYGLIGDQDLREGLKLQEETGLRLGEALVRLGKVTAEDIDWILSKQLDIPFVIVDDLCVDRDLSVRFPKDFLIKNRILPVYENDEEMAVITDDPFNQEAFEILEGITHKRLKLSSGSGRNIEEILKRSLTKGGIPSLIARIEPVITKIRETSFYRMDFFLSSRQSQAAIYGAGILRPPLN
jgi:type IV pilus assembly protein PilB